MRQRNRSMICWQTVEFEPSAAILARTLNSDLQVDKWKIIHSISMEDSNNELFLIQQALTGKMSAECWHTDGMADCNSWEISHSRLSSKVHWTQRGRHPDKDGMLLPRNTITFMRISLNSLLGSGRYDSSQCTVLLSTTSVGQKGRVAVAGL